MQFVCRLDGTLAACAEKKNGEGGPVRQPPRSSGLEVGIRASECLEGRSWGGQGTLLLFGHLRTYYLPRGDLEAELGLDTCQVSYRGTYVGTYPR